ncbi:MAG: cysteine desulfurase [Bacilli bacterium]
MNREDFSMLKDDLIYVDNSATSFKPKVVIDSMNDYYNNYCSNAHRGDYSISHKTDVIYEDTRNVVKEFINAADSQEIVFTSGATDGLNLITNSFMKYYLKEGDEVLITKSEHASNVLPWYRLEEELGIVVKFIPLDNNHHVTNENVLKMITKYTKVISLAYVTNTIGDVRDINKLGNICKENNILFVVDAAQSIGHKKIDVQKSKIDFLVASAHKMCGPTGVGFMYAKKELLKDFIPYKLGGGMNSDFTSKGNYGYNDLPNCLEAGTQNIAGVIGMNFAIKYISNIGLDKIHEHEVKLKNYLIDKIKTLDNIIIYNENNDSGLILFNINNVFPQDTARYLDHYHICVRAGNHCAKMLKEELIVKNTCRISLYLYNTIEEMDKIYEVLKNSDRIFDIVI